MKLTSPDFQNNGDIPSKFSCQGEGISPALSWSEIPAEAKSLALSCFDPDAPSGNFIHWQIINIPRSVGGVVAGETPPGDVLPNSGGESNYFPPCPPSGKHRYVFTLYALDVERLDPATTKDFQSAITPHIIEQTALTGLYQKN